MTDKKTKLCPKCGSSYVQKAGWKYTKRYGKTQRYLCLACQSIFYDKVKAK